MCLVYTDRAFSTSTELVTVTSTSVISLATTVLTTEAATTTAISTSTIYSVQNLPPTAARRVKRQAGLNLASLLPTSLLSAACSCLYTASPSFSTTISTVYSTSTILTTTAPLNTVTFSATASVVVTSTITQVETVSTAAVTTIATQETTTETQTVSSTLVLPIPSSCANTDNVNQGFDQSFNRGLSFDVEDPSNYGSNTPAGCCTICYYSANCISYFIGEDPSSCGLIIGTDQQDAAPAALQDHCPNGISSQEQLNLGAGTGSTLGYHVGPCDAAGSTYFS
jgi:hypothetical protein